MNIIRYCFAFQFFFFCQFFAAGQVTTFSKVYGGSRFEGVFNVIETPQGYLLTGQALAEDLTNNYDGLLLHIDKNGGVLWQKIYGGPLEDAFTNVVAANDGGYLVVGWLQDTLTNLADVWLAKIDDQGNMQWQKTIGDWNQYDYPIGKIIPVTGGYVLAGAYGPSGLQIRYSFLTRIDNNGNTVWSYSNNTSGPTSPAYYSPQYVRNDTIFLCGGGGATPAHWMMRDVATGNATVIRGVKGGSSETFGYMRRTTAGGHVMSGSFYPKEFGAPYFVAWAQFRPNLNGEAAWTKTYRIPGWERHFSSIEILSDSSFLMLLSNTFGTSDPVLAKIGMDGEIIWAKSFAASYAGIFGQVLPTSDGGLILVGNGRAPNNFQNGDIWVLKTDAEGRTASCCTTNQTVEVTDVIVPALPNLTMNSGNFSFSQDLTQLPQQYEWDFQTADYCASLPPRIGADIAFCPGSSVVLNGNTYTQAGQVQYFIPSTTGDCDTLAEFNLSLLPQPTRLDTVFFAPGDTVFIGGTAYVQPGLATDTLPALLGGCDTLAVFVLIFKTTGASAPSVAALKVFPNPASPEVDLRIEGRFFQRGTIALFDLAGRLAVQGEVLGNRIFLSKTPLPSGLYLYKIFENGQLVGTGKLNYGL